MCCLIFRFGLCHFTFIIACCILLCSLKYGDISCYWSFRPHHHGGWIRDDNYFWTHCWCAIFTFQPCFLHISKDVLYDSNNLVSSLMYQIPTTSFQVHKWVVGYDQYCIVGDNLIHNSQDTILTSGTAVLLSRLWKTNTKYLTFSFNVQMLLHLLFSLNCLILPQVMTWHLVVLQWDH